MKTYLNQFHSLGEGRPTEVEDYEDLIAGLDELDRDRFDVAIIDSSRDGLAQLSEILAERRDLSAVHLITLGSAGEIQPGGSRLDLGRLQADATQISGWASAFAPEGHSRQARLAIKSDRYDHKDSTQR